MKILFVGIGAVGGYFGGKLAHYFETHSGAEVCFLARGKNLDTIKKQGLKVKNLEGEFIANPFKIEESFDEVFDFVFFATKNYHLQESINKITKNVNQHTILIPLLNGLDAVDVLKSSFPNNTVANGCVYIVSRLVSEGFVENFTPIEKMYFGVPNQYQPKLEQLKEAFLKSGVEAYHPEDILEQCWEKFAFISMAATATCYFNANFGALREDPFKKDFAEQLLKEFVNLAKAKNINNTEEIYKKAWDLFNKVPPETQTSAHSDMVSGKNQVEIESLTGYIVNEAEKLSISVPFYLKAYQHLKNL